MDGENYALCVLELIIGVKLSCLILRIMNVVNFCISCLTFTNILVMFINLKKVGRFKNY